MKRIDFENFDIKNKFLYNPTYPNPYCRNKLSQCIKKSPEYRKLSLHEDTNQTRKGRFTKRNKYIPRGLTKYCFSEEDNISLEKRQYIFRKHIFS